MIMKNIYRLLIFSILLLIYSCSNDFLHEQQRVNVESADTLFMADFDAVTILNFNLLQAGNAKWRVFQYPNGVKVESLEGNYTDGHSSIKLNVPFRYDIGGGFGLLLFPLVFDVDGIGLVRYPLLLFHGGYPKFLWTGNYYDFEYTTEASFPFQCGGQGVLLWEISDKPSWITVVKQNGILSPGETEHVKLVVSKGNLPNGTYNGVIRFNNNSEEKYFELRVQMKI